LARLEDHQRGEEGNRGKRCFGEKREKEKKRGKRTCVTLASNNGKKGGTNPLCATAEKEKGGKVWRRGKKKKEGSVGL